MSANDLINFREITISKWPFIGHFEFKILYDIYLTQKRKKRKLDHEYKTKCNVSHKDNPWQILQF